jgi:iron complex outermembrane receptor protein
VQRDDAWAEQGDPRRIYVTLAASSLQWSRIRYSVVVAVIAVCELCCRHAWAQAASDGGPSILDAGASSDAGEPAEDRAAAPPVRAGEADAEAPNALSAVVVTAEKREENIQQVPLSITPVSGEKVRDLDIRASNDVARAVPNMSAATTEGRSRPRWFIRGIGNNDTSANAVSPIGVYFDEVYENFALAQAFPLFDLERVEVLRGPQGTLWGKNTTGGAISFISKKPSFDFDGYGQVTAGNYGELGLQGAGGGPIVTDRVAARASFFYESRSGYVQNVLTNKTQGDLRDAAGRFQLLVIPVDQLEANFSVHFRHNDGQSQAFYLVDSKGNPTAIPGMNGFKEGSRFYTAENGGPDIDVDDQKGGLANLKWEPGRVAITSISAYEDSSRTTNGDADYGPLDESRAYAYAHAKQFTEEVRVAPVKVDRLSWVLGAHYFQEALTSDSVSASLPAIPQPVGYGTFYSDTLFYQHTHSYAAFANAAYDFFSWFRLAAGARFTSDSKDINLGAVNSGARGKAVWNNVGNWWNRGSVQSALTPVAAQVDSRTWNAPTFDISPSFNISKDLTAYFHYGHGFRGGTFNGGVTVQSNVSVVNPETVDSYEIGVKGRLFDDRLAGSISAFHYDYQNIQVLVNGQLSVNGSTTVATVLQNAGTATGNGAEIELDALPIDRLRIHGGFGFLNATYGGFEAVNAGQTVNASGNQLVRAPHFTGLVDVEYRVPLPASTSIGIGTDWEYTSHQFFNAVDQQTTNLQQGDYVIGNARVAFYTARDRWEVQGWMHNITDTEYKILGIQGAPGYNAIMYGAPRTYGATLTARF